MGLYAESSIFASDKLIKEGVLEGLERTLSNKTIEKDKSTNTNELIEQSFLKKKKNEQNLNNCENKGCEGKRKKKLYKIQKKSYNTDVEWLSKECLKALKCKQYCYYCFLIYTSETNDNKSWIQCDFCISWVK